MALLAALAIAFLRLMATLVPEADRRRLPALRNSILMAGAALAVVALDWIAHHLA